MQTAILIFSILGVILLAAVILLQLTKNKKMDLGEITLLLKNSAIEQREGVENQISKATTVQFERFSIIQDSIQKTLQNNREETNKQLGKVAETLEVKMKSLQESNEKRLEQMQGIVDEKLQKTLETRLTQSFEIVRKQLDNVQQGLGEMKNLAADAKSLKNALTNVKERGTYGEVRLEKILSDILPPSQYDKNVEIQSDKRVEFVVKLPGNGEGEKPVLLPIDSKFPIEDYNRILEAEDKESIETARKSFIKNIRAFAKDIHDKYIFPPKTTDFALMFLPTEGLYAEVLRDPALFEELLTKYKITPVGPTTLSAVLSSLLFGFKTLAIEKRSQEVWEVLKRVKKEFITFGAALEKAQKQIRTADATLGELSGKRTRQINRALTNVEHLSIEADSAGSIDNMNSPAGELSADDPVDIDPVVEEENIS
ncbi:MAG: DNA recombination protein RmuC [Elusimicrobiota bacterium]|jgi:DNA recombination protein RmuC|nr:DNA recombination protein RmuC [Elusimicrobiota bacterium]